MKLVLSTDGLAKPNYEDYSTVQETHVPRVEDIQYGRLMGSGPNRKYVYVDLTPSQALGVAFALLNSLREELRDEG